VSDWRDCCRLALGAGEQPSSKRDRHERPRAQQDIIFNSGPPKAEGRGICDEGGGDPAPGVLRQRVPVLGS